MVASTAPFVFETGPSDPAQAEGIREKRRPHGNQPPSAAIEVDLIGAGAQHLR
jgi:hypothetical protein